MSNLKRRIPVHLKSLPDGRVQFHVEDRFEILGTELPENIQDMIKPSLLHAKVTPPRRKIAASRWFLKQLSKCIENEAAALMFMESFLSELRATTFTLQKLLSSVPGFSEWYEQQRQDMQCNKNLQWLVKARNEAQKIGIEFASWGCHIIVKFPLNGDAFAESLPPILTITALDRTVTVFDLEQMLVHIERLVEEAHDRFYPHPPNRNYQMVLETLRELEDGSWEHFDVGTTK